MLLSQILVMCFANDEQDYQLLFRLKDKSNLTFKLSVTLTLHVYNCDANRAKVKVNNVSYNVPYNAISISASSSPGSGGWVS